MLSEIITNQEEISSYRLQDVDQCCSETDDLVKS